MVEIGNEWQRMACALQEVLNDMRNLRQLNGKYKKVFAKDYLSLNAIKRPSGANAIKRAQANDCH